MFINPYSEITEGKGKWFKANFHTHAGSAGHDTCGIYDIEDVIELYRQAGYGVLTISNHDLYTDTGTLNKNFDIKLINGFEYSRAEHMLCIGCKSLISGEHQEVIDSCVEQGGFVIMCHPNWQRKEYWSPLKLEQLKNYTGIEIFNSVIGRLDGTGVATDVWDYLLTRGRLVWGFGNDDFHRWYDLKKSWNMIYSVSDNYADIKEAIDNGRFYTSSGLELEELTYSDGKIRVKAYESGCYPTDYEYIFIGENGKILKRQTGMTGEFCFAGNEAYVRVKVIGEQGYILWTQPVYNQKHFHD
jgi:hypothetical protein